MNTHLASSIRVETRDTFDTRKRLSPGNYSLGNEFVIDTTEIGGKWDSVWFDRETELLTSRFGRSKAFLSAGFGGTDIAAFYSSVPSGSASTAGELLPLWLSNESMPGSTWPTRENLGKATDWSKWLQLRKKAKAHGLTLTEASELVRLSTLASIVDENHRLTQAVAIERAEKVHADANGYLQRLAQLASKLAEDRNATEGEEPTR